MDKLTSVSSESFLRNQLSSEVESAYEQVLYPKQGYQNKSAIQRSSYSEFIGYLVEVSARLNLLMSSYVIVSRLGFSDAAKAQINQLRNGITPNLKADAQNSMTLVLNSGRSHIIKPSKTFKGGFDFVYSGLPESGISVKPSGYAVYDSTVADKPESINDDILSDASQVYKFLFGKPVSIKEAHTRVINTLSIKSDFSSLDGFLRELGIDLFSDLKLPKVVEGLSDYFKILVIKEPIKRLVTAKLAADNPQTVDNASIVQDEFNYLFNPSIYFSLSMSLPKEWCEYISQVSGSEPVHLNSLNTWVTTWSSVAFSVRGKKGDKDNAKRESGGKLNFKYAPRYILSASHLTQLPQVREKNGFYIENGRTNEDNLYVSSSGSLQWCPKATDVDNSVANDYEAKLDKALELSFEAGTPLVMSMNGSTHPVFELNSPGYKTDIKAVKESLASFGSQILTYNWDYNTIVTSGKSSPEKLVTTSLAGATVPDEITLDNILQMPSHQAFVELAPTYYDEEKFEASVVPGPIITVVRYYEILEKAGRVPKFEALVKQAAAKMNINSLQDPSVVEYDSGLYTYISNDLSSVPLTGDSSKGRFEKTLEEVLFDANGSGRSKLARASLKAGIEIDEDPHYYSTSVSLAKFANVFNYVGGRVIQLAMQELCKIKHSGLKPTKDMAGISADDLVEVVMPVATVLSKYCPGAQAINEKAEQLKAKLKPDENLQIGDLKFPGVNDGVQLFPHQFEGHRVLNNAPKFGFLDVAPGGGKTISALLDIMNLSGKGLIRRPIIFAPNRLVKNWADDLAKITSRWNVIPINLQQFRLWGEERLTKMIQKAPRNTIVVCGYRFLNGDKYALSIGSTSIQVSGTLEFLKKFNFDYICCDESHRTKNARSFTHRGVKQLSTCSTVKFVRLATGSIIQDKLTDVVGQAAIMTSAMFKTADDFEDANIVTDIDPDTGKKIRSWRPDAAENARKILAKNVAVITAKRRDWAFMLPTPDETFIPVAMDVEGDNTHSLMYQAVLKETLDEIKETRPDIIRMLTSSSSEDDDDDEGDGDSKDKAADTNVYTEDDDKSEEISALLEPYIARLEQCLTDPLGDKFGEVFFKGIERGDFVSNKVKRIISRINDHFNVAEFEKGKEYTEWDFCQFKGKTYQLRRFDLELDKQKYKAVKDPASDERWAERSKGKILIFCRYVRSVGAIYEALPPQLKKIAVQFSSGEKGSTQNLAKFKSSPDVQILIANEQAISEGQNLQMAGRLIRVETPWAPGELDQAICRIFRPDPGGKEREMIYLDWIVTNGSLEVPKMGRLIAKMLAKTQFDEYGNKNYDKLQNISLPMIRMDLSTISSTQNLSDIRDTYIDVYQTMASIQGYEFRLRKKAGNTKMLDVTPAPMFEDASIIENVPYVPDQNVADRNNLGLTKASVYIDVNKINDLSKLQGMKAHTEFGNGIIVKVAQAKADGATRNLRQIWVQLAQTGEIYKADPSVVYIADNLTDADLSKLKKVSPWADAKTKKLAEKLELKAEKLREKEERIAAKAMVKAAKMFEKASKVLSKPKKKEKEVEVDTSASLFPVSYNGYLGLKAASDEEGLEKYGFKPFGDFAFLNISKLTEPQYDKLLDYLDDTFEVPNALGKKLLTLGENFNSRTKKFDVDLSSVADFKNFYRISHTKGGKDEDTGKWVLKIYPMVGRNSILLKVDIATNPYIKRYIGKKIPGLPISWDSDDGMEIWMSKLNTQGDVVRKVKEISNDGFTIENFDDVKETLESMKTRNAKKK